MAKRQPVPPPRAGPPTLSPAGLPSVGVRINLSPEDLAAVVRAGERLAGRGASRNARFRAVLRAGCSSLKP